MRRFEIHPYAPMIIRAPIKMNDSPYIFPRDDISAIEFHPEITHKEKKHSNLKYNLLFWFLLQKLEQIAICFKNTSL
jgi:hypothetical protein